MVIVLAHITVVAGRETEFEAIAHELRVATLANETGVLRYEYLRLSEPSTYLATLAFDDYDAFLEHQASDHHHVIAGAMRDLIADLRLERVDPVPGCSSLQQDEPVPVRPIEPSPHAVLAERTEHYRERYPLDPPGWWDTPC